jgi:hypothetical protein
MDVTEFGAAGFDPVAWINAACTNRSQQDEPLDKFLAELEMRLQLSAEDIEASLSDTTNQALRRIPFAIQEIYRLQGDIQGMQDQVQVLAHTVQRDATEATSSVGYVSQLHKARVNMESACSSLRCAVSQRASELSVIQTVGPSCGRTLRLPPSASRQCNSLSLHEEHQPACHKATRLACALARTAFA